MTSSSSVLRPLPTPRVGERWLALLASGAVGVVLAYTAASVAGAPGASLSLVFLAAILGLAPLAWGAFVRAPQELRLLCAFLASAATLWLLGSVVWFAHHLGGGEAVPKGVGPWQIPFVLAYLLAITGVYLGMRRAVSFRQAALDASVLAAAGAALAAALVEPALHGRPGSLVAVACPLLGLLVLMLVASAAAGRWQGLPLSVVLFGLGQVFLTADAMASSYVATQRSVFDAELSDVGRLAGAVVSMLAASIIILGLDRPVRLAKTAEIPGYRVGSTLMQYVAFCGLAVALGVTFYGHATDRQAPLVAGLAASLWIGAVMALRARGAIRDLERAYKRLDRAHFRLERTNDRLAAANEDLARANVQLRTVHTAFEDLLLIVDERSGGELRTVVEGAGEDVARLLDRYFPDPEG